MNLKHFFFLLLSLSLIHLSSFYFLYTELRSSSDSSNSATLLSVYKLSLYRFYSHLFWVFGVCIFWFTCLFCGVFPPYTYILFPFSFLSYHSFLSLISLVLSFLSPNSIFSSGHLYWGYRCREYIRVLFPWCCVLSSCILPHWVHRI